jgi:hypothetical protein
MQKTGRTEVKRDEKKMCVYLWKMNWFLKRENEHCVDGKGGSWQFKDQSQTNHKSHTWPSIIKLWYCALLDLHCGRKETLGLGNWVRAPNK